MLANLKAWAAEPFSPDMGIKGWFAFGGLVLATFIGWKIILHHITTETGKL